MNIKSLRKNYNKLSKRERFILYDAAENRDDKGEMDAIMLATPNEDWIKPDFALQAEQILKMRLVMLIQQLKHCREAIFWFAISETEEQTNESQEDCLYFNFARLKAYFYCVKVESSRSIFEEIGLDVDAWETKQNEIFGLDFVDEMMDWLMREIAFDEKETQVFINKLGKERGFGNVELGFTYENELKSLREILKGKGFEEYFKS